MRYSDEYKRSIVAKALEADGKKLDEIARDSGVHPATMGRWMQQFRAGTLEAGRGDGIQPSRRNPG